MLIERSRTRRGHAGSLRACGFTAAALASLAGCTNPFATRQSDRAKQVPQERLRTVDRLDLEPYAQPAPPPPKAGETPARPPSRFEGVEKLDLSLDQVRAATLENNLDLKVALVDPVIAGQALREEEAKFEAVFTPSIRYIEDDNPTLDVTTINQQNATLLDAGVDIPLRSGGRATVDLIENYSETPNPFVTLNSSWSSALAFSLSQPLLRNAGRKTNSHSIRIAGYDEQISEARTKLEVIRQLAAADRSYWRLYAARRELEVRQREYELAVAQLDKSRRRVEAGDLAEVEVIRAQAGVAERLEAIIIAENAVLNQQRELKRILNIPDLELETATQIVTTTEPAPVPYSFDAPKLADLGVDNRMEMLELELQLLADLSSIDFAKNQALPLITLDYSYSIDGLGETFSDANSQLRGNRFESWTVGLSGQVPLGNEAAKARVQQAILGRLQRLSTKDARRLSIRQEVLSAIDGVEASWQRILAARQSAMAAARTLEAEQRQFDVGARTSTDVLDAATRLANAQSAEISALTDYQISLVDLSFATGTLLGAAKVDWEPRDPRTADRSGADPAPPTEPPMPRQPDSAPAPAGHN
jgi:outer membrane protein TolC